MKRNTVAQDLRTPKYKKRVVQLKTTYNRKKNKKIEKEGILKGFMNP